MTIQHTIVALATPAGRSGVAIIRVSGIQAFDAVKILAPNLEKSPRKALLQTLVCPHTSEMIDRALVLYFPAPNSFTGEDVVELHVHGSRAVIQAILAFLSEIDGVRLAEAGEFTRRAFTNGKLDLLEVEALADLIDAETERQRIQALKQLSGNTSKHYQDLRQSVVQALALIEAHIDFPDEDIPQETLAHVGGALRKITGDIETLMADNSAGERIREGFTVVIMGAPNVGKSTLLNALAKRDVAIVSDIAGTTRDMLEVHMDIGGYPVTLIDTAGIREKAESIEAIGIERALKRAENADIVLWLMDSPCPPPHPDALPVFTKADLRAHNEGLLAISAHTGEGLESLINAIKQRIDAISGRSSVLITRARHRQHLALALQCLYKAQSPLPLELRCEELRLAAREIGKITGKIAVDELLDVVFSTFCIGK
jgi:tRNA modification GTPase